VIGTKSSSSGVDIRAGVNTGHCRLGPRALAIRTCVGFAPANRALGSSRTCCQDGGLVNDPGSARRHARAERPSRGVKDHPGSWCRLNTSLVGRFRWQSRKNRGPDCAASRGPARVCARGAWTLQARDPSRKIGRCAFVLFAGLHRGARLRLLPGRLRARPRRDRRQVESRPLPSRRRAVVLDQDQESPVQPGARPGRAIRPLAWSGPFANFLRSLLRSVCETSGNRASSLRH
jgi:hypothetical protein